MIEAWNDWIEERQTALLDIFDRVKTIEVSEYIVFAVEKLEDWKI